MPIAIKSFIGTIDRYVKDINPAIALKVNFSDDRIDYVLGETSGAFLTREQLDCSHAQKTELSKEEVLVALACYRALSISKFERVAA